MRIHSAVILFCALLSSAVSSASTYESRDQALVPLDQLISPMRQAQLADELQKNREYLDQLARTADRGGAVDLRYRDTEVQKQFGGTCTAFGLIAAMENVMGGQVHLSERHFWSQYAQYSCKAALKTATTSTGIVEYVWWPSANANPYVGYLDQPWHKLTDYQELGADIKKAIASLDEGYPVYTAISTPTDMMNCSTKISPNTGHYKNSGHAISIVGYEIDANVPGGGFFLLKNSWGTDCGDHGYQWYPFNLCAKPGMYCEFWSIRGTAVSSNTQSL